MGVRLWLWVGVRSGVDAGGWTALGQACGMSCLDGFDAWFGFAGVMAPGIASRTPQCRALDRGLLAPSITWLRVTVRPHVPERTARR